MVIVGILIPYSPLARALGFTHLPGPFYAFLAVATVTYLLLVEVGKRLLFSRAEF
jgi:Mg2+-importing ATPase